MSWKITFYALFFFLKFTKKNRDKIWKMKILKEDQIEKKNLILYIILNKINNKKNKNQIW